MANHPQKIHRIISGSYLRSASACFLIVVVMAIVFAYDLEDQIFENQVSIKADELAASAQPLPTGKQTVSGLKMEYYEGIEAMPVWLSSQIKSNWTTGEYEIFGGERGHFHLAVRTGADATKKYLLFNARPYVRSTDQNWAFVFFMTILGGLMLLIVVYFLRRMTKKLTNPIETLANAVTSKNQLNTLASQFTDAPQEIGVLASAIAEKDARIDSLLERERQFNRDVSHELRTPLSVAMGAAEIIEAKENNDPAFSRLRSALSDMQLLTEGILWLGRPTEERATCQAKKVCDHAVGANKHMLKSDAISVEIVGDEDVEIPVPEAVAQVIIGNIVRNAFAYTETGYVKLFISEGVVQIQDSGIGFGQASNEDQGFGVGLSLVERLCSHFGLGFAVAPSKNMGTEAMVSW